jgi:hypothetical protein
MSLQDEKDRKLLSQMQTDKLLDLFALHVRNIWRVDGLYFLGVEERFGTDIATKIDANCWNVMGKIEARSLRKILKVEKITPTSFLKILKHTSWALDLWGKEGEISEAKVVSKDLDIFPCRKVRYGYLEAFARELNPEIQMNCKICPPGERPEGIWCEWEFNFKN